MRMRIRLSGRLAATAALVGAAMFIFAWAGIYLTRDTDRIAAVWLANGAVLAIVLRCARRDWPVLLAVAFVANSAANIVSGDLWWFGACLAVLNVIEIAVAASIVVLIFGPEDRFDSRPAIVHYLVAALLAPGVSATLATTFLFAATGAAWGSTLIHWYVADALGLLTVTPLLLSLRQERVLAGWRDTIELLVFMAMAGAFALVIFGQSRQSFLFLFIPIVMLAALRLRLHAALLVVAVISAVAIERTIAGEGRIAASGANLTERVYVLQLFIAVQMFIVLPLRALIGERDRLGLAFAESDRLFRRISEASPAGIIHFDAEARATYVNARWTELTGQGFDALSGEHWLDSIDQQFRVVARALWIRARDRSAAIG